MTTPHEIDLHSEYLRADLFLAMGQPIEAAKVLEAVVTAEPDNEAALELLARSYFGSAQLNRAETALTRLVVLAPANAWGPARPGPHAGAAEPPGGRRRAPPGGRRPRRRLTASGRPAGLRVEPGGPRWSRAVARLHLRGRGRTRG